MRTGIASIGRTARRLCSPTAPRVLLPSASATRVQARYQSTVLESNPRGFLLRSNEPGKQINTLLSKFWLRDNCRCNDCVHQNTMQRNFDTFQIPAAIEASEISPGKDGVAVTWSDSHKSHYPWSWFFETLNRSAQGSLAADSGKKLWGASIASSPPEVSFEDVMSSKSLAGIANLTDKIRTFGFCFVAGTPATPEASEELLATVGPIRNTHYGAFYDFVPDLAKADTAYTNIALAAHTDTTYFTEPAGLQAFHLLSHTPPPNKAPEEVLGGQSLLVDGFHAAQVLKQESPEDYETLHNVNVPWHASGNDGVAIAPDRAYPVFEGEGGELHRVRWNNDDRGVIPLDVDVNAWYKAARKWNEILRRKDSEYWFQLQPGRMLIFDNWRVLHGRSAFEGLRRICGGYGETAPATLFNLPSVDISLIIPNLVNRDDFISRWKTSNFARDEVISFNMQLR